MQNYLIKQANNPSTDAKGKITHCVYMNRMQKRIDREMKMMLWLAVNYPKFLLDEDKEYKDDEGNIKRNRRLKTLMLTTKAVINPKMNVQLVMDNLSIPEEIKIIQ